MNMSEKSPMEYIEELRAKIKEIKKTYSDEINSLDKYDEEYLIDELALEAAAYDGVCKVYDTIVKTVIEHKVGYVGIVDYAKFFFEEKEYIRAFGICKRFEEDFNENKEIAEVDRAYYHYYYGLSAYKLVAMETESEKNFLKAVELFKEIRKNDIYSCGAPLVKAYTHLALICSKKNDTGNQEKFHLLAEKLSNKIIKVTDDLECKECLVANYYGLANLFLKTDYNKASFYYSNLIEIGEKLPLESYKAYMYELADSYCRLGYIYHKVGLENLAEKHYKKAKRIFYELDEKGSERYIELGKRITRSKVVTAIYGD